MRAFTLALPAGVLTGVYRRSEPPETCCPIAGGAAAEGGYVDLDGDGTLVDTLRPHLLLRRAGATPRREELARGAAAFLRRRGAIVDPFGNVDDVSTYDPHDLLAVETIDAIGNVDPRRDRLSRACAAAADRPERQPFRVAFDALGLVAGTAVMGKVGREPDGDSLDGFEPDLSAAQVVDAFFADPHGTARLGLLGGATTRIVYDVDRYLACRRSRPLRQRSRAKPTSPTLQPGEQTQDPSQLQLLRRLRPRDPEEDASRTRVRCADGARSRSPRWIGSGWTIFNNKGKPVRQYEPFFTASHDFEFAAIEGREPDPVLRPGRARRRHAASRTRPTRRSSSTPGGKPAGTSTTPSPPIPPPIRTSATYFRRLPERDYLPTWYERRIGGGTGPGRAAAAEKAAAPCRHAHDRLFRHARPHLPRHRRQRRPPANTATRTVLDIEGNRRAVIDALGRVRHPLRLRHGAARSSTQASMEAGEHWHAE